MEVEKPFAQEAELAEKLERLSALNALLNMDEKGDDAALQCEQVGMDDAPEEENKGQEASDLEHDDQRQEKAVENSGHNHVAENGSLHELKLEAGKTDKPAKASLKEKLEAYKAQVADVGNTGTVKTKGKEEVI